MRRLFGVLLLICLDVSPAWGAWAFTGVSNSTTGSGAGSFTLACNGTAAGSLIAVGASIFNSITGITGVTVSDATNGAYTQSFRAVLITSVEQDATLHYFPNNAGGNLTITVNPAAPTDLYDVFIVCAEFSGGDTTAPASGTPATNTGSSTTASTGSTTPADNDVLVLAMEGHTASGTITENAGGEGFTLIAENESGVLAEPGSMVYKIISGSPSAQSESWTVPLTSDWAAGIAAYKPAAAAPGAAVSPPQRSLMGVGQ